jgi:MFS family permease
MHAPSSNIGFSQRGGSLADRVGRRRVFVSGMGVFTVTSLWCAVAASIGELDAARRYLQEILHLSPIQAGLVYLPGAVVIFLVSAIGAQLVTKVPPSVLVASGLTLVAAGLALILLTDTNSSWTALLPGLQLCCLGTGLFNPPPSRSRSSPSPSNKASSPPAPTTPSGEAASPSASPSSARQLRAGDHAGRAVSGGQQRRVEGRHESTLIEARTLSDAVLGSTKGGGAGIRTQEALARPTVFKSAT